MTTHTTSAAPQRRLGLAVLAAAVLTLFSALLVVPSASAQEAPPTLTVTSHVLDGTGEFTATVALEPGTEPLGAIAALLEYDRSALAILDCSTGDLGVCHDAPDGLSFAGIAPQGFAADPSFVAIRFAVVTPGVTTDLLLSVRTVASVTGAPIEGAVAFSGLVAPAEAPAAEGGLNGEVLDQNSAGLFGMQVCAIAVSGESTCTVTTGLGAFILDGLEGGDYSLVLTDPNELLASQSMVVTVKESEVTTGISVTMAPPSAVDVPEAPTAVVVPEPEAPVDIAPLEAAADEIAVQVLAASGGFPVFGANVCATMPLIGTQTCNFSDADGVARLSNLGVGNYELSASDPAGRFGAAEPIFVGLNRGEGVVAELSLLAPGLGEPPEALAYVDRGVNGAEAGGIAMTGLALAVMAAGALGTRRRR